MAGNDNDGEVQMSNTKCQLFRWILEFVIKSAML